jgi:hypothetical protein
MVGWNIVTLWKKIVIVNHMSVVLLGVLWAGSAGPLGLGLEIRLDLS